MADNNDYTVCIRRETQTATFSIRSPRLFLSFLVMSFISTIYRHDHDCQTRHSLHLPAPSQLSIIGLTCSRTCGGRKRTVASLMRMVRTKALRAQTTRRGESTRFKNSHSVQSFVFTPITCPGSWKWFMFPPWNVRRRCYRVLLDLSREKSNKILFLQNVENETRRGICTSCKSGVNRGTSMSKPLS